VQPQDDKSYLVTGRNYTALVDAEGNLRSLKIDGREVLSSTPPHKGTRAGGRSPGGLAGRRPEGCPYVFMDERRWQYYRQRVSDRKWRQGQDLVSNLLRRFKTLCRRAGVGPYTIHDLRRSCITNWARHLPIHVVQQLAGYSDIKTTQAYYLSVQEDDLERARQIQGELLRSEPARGASDPKVTHSGQNGEFSTPQGKGGES
jgi:hypothetical protein